MFSAVTRATVSVGPPAAKGTIMVMGRLGKSWAIAADAVKNSNEAHTTARMKHLPGSFFVQAM
jgi:hypothetical protein